MHFVKESASLSFFLVSLMEPYLEAEKNWTVALEGLTLPRELMASMISLKRGSDDEIRLLAQVDQTVTVGSPAKGTDISQKSG
ncbi:hypothetical protein RB195_024494 [Necator americanus]|uniref:Uncharacterized protein n=1 Tax=Necator americanus TaxID=51031 RepID=A0ABR1ENI9_NECAM